jgi:crotonobetainyl-CoA:carnitine CoA-transferase CaiB-like acyl-CoA transferase
MAPLDGIRVLDLSRHAPGRYTSMILADLGADVITIETPRGTDTSLSFQFTDDTWYRYLGMNCNKRSIAINLKSPRGRELAYLLVDKADVLIEAFRPGVVERLGMDYVTLSKRNPRLVYCSITGYGQDSPYANRASHDINVVAMTGILGATGPRTGSPVFMMFPCISDISTFCQAIASIVPALYAREKTGKGQYLDVSITDGTMFFNWVMNMRYLASGEISDRGTLPTGSDMAWLNVYKTKDNKYIALSCQELQLWSRLCRLMKREEFIPHHFDLGDKQREMYEALSQAFATKTRDEWMKALDEADVAAAPVYTIAEAYSDAHFKHRQPAVEVGHPKLGTVRVLQSPLRFSDTPVQPRTRPPLYAENTAEILRDLAGMSEQEIDRLRDEGVVE